MKVIRAVSSKGYTLLVKKGKGELVAKGEAPRTLVAVSEVLEVVARPRIVQWAVDLALKKVEEGEPLEVARLAHERVREEAAQTGRRLHAFVKSFLQGTPPPDLLKEEEAERAAAFLRWWREKSPVPVAVEELVAHPEKGYYGRLDLLVELEGRLTLVDLKATNAFHPHGEIQLGAYAMAVEAWWGIKVEAALLLRLEAARASVREADLKAGREAFLAALALYRFLAARGGLRQKEEE